MHNHLMEESPRVLYVHYMRHGQAVQLATSRRAALALSRTPLEKPAAATEESAPAWVKAVEDAVARKGTFKGGVLSYGVPRSDAITMGGMTIPPKPQNRVLGTWCLAISGLHLNYGRL